MPDISKCNNGICPLRYSCYRYTSPPSPMWQAYADFKFTVVDEEVECDYYWEDEKIKKQNDEKL
jgi:hypothetical protein